VKLNTLCSSPNIKEHMGEYLSHTEKTEADNWHVSELQTGV